ncbi:MAG: hypothetical protein KME30_05615 [Iphinoe sp. HA4291-MV1]|nr:hypothetical protein [Iphinoe sp. HA4291-MV1]
MKKKSHAAKYEIMSHLVKKGSESGFHPVLPDEKEALVQLQELYPGWIYVFASERGECLSVDAIK